MWHPAPWSLALIVGAWRVRGRVGAALTSMPERSRRALYFALGFSSLSIAMFVPASRFAERYPFSAHYAIATAGVVVGLQVWPSLRTTLGRIDRAVPAFPVVVWVSLMLLRLTVGALLPRISG